MSQLLITQIKKAGGAFTFCFQALHDSEETCLMMETYMCCLFGGTLNPDTMFALCCWNWFKVTHENSKLPLFAFFSIIFFSIKSQELIPFLFNLPTRVCVFDQIPSFSSSPQFWVLQQSFKHNNNKYFCFIHSVSVNILKLVIFINKALFWAKRNFFCKSHFQAEHYPSFSFPLTIQQISFPPPNSFAALTRCKCWVLSPSSLWLANVAPSAADRGRASV